jgi:hypothetical protein
MKNDIFLERKLLGCYILDLKIEDEKVYPGRG